MGKTRLNHQAKFENKGLRGSIVYIIVPVLIVLGMFVYFKYSSAFKQENTYDQIAYIRSFYRNGVLNDYANKIGMKDPETDLKWYKEDDSIKIEYGYMLLTFTTEEFLSEKAEVALAEIGITREVKVNKKDGTKKLKVYYNGKEIERWVTSVK